MKLETLTIDSLKEIVTLAKEEGVSELKVEGKDFKVSVNFSKTNPSNQHEHSINHQPLPPVAAAMPAKSSSTDTGFHVIKSPFVGTFYTSPSPGKPPYAKSGDKVKVGQPLCVLEAMKIMNEIDSDVNGEIVEVCVDNESLVEFGQALFKIKPH